MTNPLTTFNLLVEIQSAIAEHGCSNRARVEIDQLRMEHKENKRFNKIARTHIRILELLEQESREAQLIIVPLLCGNKFRPDLRKRAAQNQALRMFM